MTTTTPVSNEEMERQAKEGYYLSESDRCPDTAPTVFCYDELDYCLEWAENKWREHYGSLTMTICHGETKVVTFHPVDYDLD